MRSAVRVNKTGVYKIFKSKNIQIEDFKYISDYFDNLKINHGIPIADAQLQANLMLTFRDWLKEEINKNSEFNFQDWTAEDIVKYTSSQLKK